MKPVVDFLQLSIFQRNYIEEMLEYDQLCRSPDAWCRRVGRIVDGARRRGWTRRDKLLAKYYEASLLSLPALNRKATTMPEPLKRRACRMDMLFRMCKFQDAAVSSAKTALDVCKKNPHFVRSAGGAVSDLLSLHLRWLDYIQADNGYPANIEHEWNDSKCRLQGICDVLTEVEQEATRERVPLSTLATEFDVSRGTIYSIERKGYLKTHGDPKFVYRDELDPIELKRLIELQRKRQLREQI